MKLTFATLLLLLSAVSWGQTVTSQEISGLIQDISGSAVPNVTVTVKNGETGFIRTAQANESGYYVVSNLPIGTYELSVEVKGFKKFVNTGLVLNVNSKLQANVRLEVGNVTESVTVAADAVQVETATGEVGRLVTGEQATNLQLNGRNFPQLLQLLPGVSTTFSSGFGLFGGYGVNNSAQSINGSRTDTFSWNLDGADNKDNGGGGNNFVNINPDAIAEFKVLTTNYSAEYGNSAGAVVNIAIRGGTKEFHGGAYEYLRNDAIQARAYNATIKPELRYNNFGVNLGGPAFIPKIFNTSKDKFFFFGGLDFKRLRQGAINTWTVPSPAQINGDFSALGAAKWPKDPLTGAVFPNGIIPQNRFSANSYRLLQNYPAPNFTGSGGNFVFPTVAPLSTNQYILKGDYNVNSKNQISVHWLRDYYESLQNLTNLALYERHIPGTNAAAHWTFVANASTVNSVQFSFTGNVIKEKVGIRANTLFVNDFSRKGEGVNYPLIYNAADFIPSISISGFNGLSVTPLNFDNFNRVFQWKDDFSKLIGNHNLKAGMMAMRSRKNQDNVPAINGSFAFSTSASNTTTNALADALLGNFYTYTEAGSFRQGWYRFTQVEPYVQDDWKVNSRLTVNLGLRWEYMQPQYSALNNTSAFLPQYYNPAKAPQIVRSTGAIVQGTGDPYNGLVLGGNGFPDAAKGRVPVASDPAVLALFHNLPKGTAQTYNATWAPRIGFALDLSGHQNTVVRGGFGAFYERIEGNFIFSSVNNAPFIQQSTVYNGNVENPSGGALQVFPAAVNNSHYLDMKVPRTLNWSLGVQQKLTKDTMLDVAYVGSSAANLSYQQDINQLPLGTALANPGVNVNALRPYPGYADIYEYMTGANFIYNSLQVQFKKQLAGGGMFNAAYTWSKSRTDANGYNYQPMDSYNLRGDWGPSSYNRNHVLALSYVYPLPFWKLGREWYKVAFGGWQVSGVTTLQTGLPFNVTIPTDTAGTGLTNQRPNVIGAWQGPTRTQFLAPAAFATPAAGTFGNLGAYAIYYPFFNNWDVSVQKTFRATDRINLAFRAEFFNVPNHLSYTGISSTYTSSTFGQITGATDPRTMEFALRLTF
uniref:TonB-dependent receptor, plug n=1 Tax=Solibacter usitatus (strain Ellin6076) TaxID=234267 RepID=Q020J2_SOLUE